MIVPFRRAPQLAHHGTRRRFLAVGRLIKVKRHEMGNTNGD